jgi:hypothetical protein
MDLVSCPFYRPVTRRAASDFMEGMVVKDFAYTNGKELLPTGRGRTTLCKHEHKIGGTLHDSFPVKYVD